MRSARCRSKRRRMTRDRSDRERVDCMETSAIDGGGGGGNYAGDDDTSVRAQRLLRLAFLFGRFTPTPELYCARQMTTRALYSSGFLRQEARAHSLIPLPMATHCIIRQFFLRLTLNLIVVRERVG